MKKRKKMAVLALSASVLAAAWLLAEYTLRQQTEQTLMPMEEAESIDLSIGRAREFVSLSWSWEGRTVNLRWDDGAACWMNAEDAGCPVDNASALALARAAAQTRASMVIENATDLGQYGLDEPSLVIVAATEDETAAYEVGNMSITGEYYVRLTGGNAVYLENGALSAFRVGLEEILTVDSVPADMTEVTGLRVSSEAGDYEMQFVSEPEPAWYRLGETSAQLKETRVRELIRLVREAELSECVAWDADLSEYGLDEPILRVTMFYRDENGADASFSLEFGDYEGEEVYVRVPDSDRIYRTSAGIPDGLMYPDWSALELATVMTSPDLEHIHSIEVTLDGQSHEILRLEEEREVSAGEDEPVMVTDVIYSANGWVLDTGRVEKWLTELAGMTVDESAPTGEGRGTLLSVTLVWQDPEGVPAELELRSYDSEHDLCVVGGDRYLLVSRTEAEAILESANTLLDMGAEA